MDNERLASFAVGTLIGFVVLAALSATGCFTLFFDGGFSVGYPGHWFLVVSRYGVNTWHETEFTAHYIWEW